MFSTMYWESKNRKPSDYLPFHMVKMRKKQISTRSRRNRWIFPFTPTPSRRHQHRPLNHYIWYTMWKTLSLSSLLLHLVARSNSLATIFAPPGDDGSNNLFLASDMTDGPNVWTQVPDSNNRNSPQLEIPTVDENNQSCFSHDTNQNPGRMRARRGCRDSYNPSPEQNQNNNGQNTVKERPAPLLPPFFIEPPQSQAAPNTEICGQGLTNIPVCALMDHARAVGSLFTLSFCHPCTWFS